MAPPVNKRWPGNRAEISRFAAHISDRWHRDAERRIVGLINRIEGHAEYRANVACLRRNRKRDRSR